MSTDVFLWDESFEPADIVLRTSAAATGTSTGGGTGGRRRRWIGRVPSPRDYPRIPEPPLRLVGHGVLAATVAVTARAATGRSAGWLTVALAGRGHVAGPGARFVIGTSHQAAFAAAGAIEVHAQLHLEDEDEVLALLLLA